MRSLLSNRELIRYSGLGPTFPECEVRQIRLVELAEFRNCLGIAMYNYLLAHVVDYSSTAQWASGTTYATNDLVVYKGDVYKAKQASTGVEPPTYTHWGLAPKFDEACTEALWCDFLAEFLAYAVLNQRLPWISNQIKAEGVVVMRGNSFDPASDKGVRDLQAAVLGAKELAFDNLDWYLRDQFENNTTCGPILLYKPLDAGACSGCGQAKASCSGGCGEEGAVYSQTLDYEVG